MQKSWLWSSVDCSATKQDFQIISLEEDIMAHQCRPPKPTKVGLQWQCSVCSAKMIVKEFCGCKIWGRK